MAHTENMIVVYVSNEEKEQIRNVAKIYGKAMSRYLLDLHLYRVIGYRTRLKVSEREEYNLKNQKKALGPYTPPKPPKHHPQG